MRRNTSRILGTLFLGVVMGIWATASLPAQIMIPSRSGAPPIEDALSMKVVLYQVPPGYPVEARKSHLTGHGILAGRVDPRTGIVTAVRMEKSTGYKVLDDAALNAFQQWRFKPGAIRKFRTPISFTMSHQG
jgi:protein TonB